MSGDVASADPARLPSGGSPRGAIAPVRGGIDSIYGIYIGGSPLDQNYKQTIRTRLTYRFATQRRHVKTISSIEQHLISARDSVTSLKFDGRLEATVGSATEIGKERFLSLLSRRVEEHGHETFYYAKNSSGEVVNVLEHSHNFTLEMMVSEYELRSDFENLTLAAFDDYEMRDITLSRLVVESMLTSTFYEKIFIRYGHRDDFKLLPGSGLLMMALETCNASVSHDIDGATESFILLTLDTYPGENVSDFATEALRLVKIMQGGYALPVNTSSRLLIKVSKTSCEEFNRKIFNLLDKVKTLEYKYKVLDPKELTKDPAYSTYGPIAILSILQQAYGRLLSTHDWPALATKLPQSNHVSAPPKANIQLQPKASGSSMTTNSSSSIKCFRCQGPHHIRDCPRKAVERSNKPIDGAVTPRATHPLAPWKYLEPKDLSQTVTDAQGRIWKFCTKCKCRHTKRAGIFQLSHTDATHVDSSPDIPNSVSSSVTPVAPPESNLAPYASDLQFHGIWFTPIVSTLVDVTATAPTVAQQEPDSSTHVFDPDGFPIVSSANVLIVPPSIPTIPASVAQRETAETTTTIVESSTRSNIAPLFASPVACRYCCIHAYPSDCFVDLWSTFRANKPANMACRLHLLPPASCPSTTLPSVDINMSIISSPMSALEFLTLFIPPALSTSPSRHPVIFDTGASLAISPFRDDFSESMSIPPGDLKLGGMANGLTIEGMGTVTWFFTTITGEDVSIQSMAYFVPGAKVRLISPQRLFDLPNGKGGHYFGDSTGLHLHLGDNIFKFAYDARNSLPIGYALVNRPCLPNNIVTPEINLSVQDDANQNLTAGQKLLLHWHYRFGHLNFPAVQRLFRAAPFTLIKFSAAAKCDMALIRCAICEFAKAHRRPSKSGPSSTPLSTADDPTIGSLKVNHLKPGVQVSVDHFESRLLGRTFDSFGKASSATYKGGCIFVDHSSGYIHVEHQVGFSAVETIRAKQAFEQFAIANGVVVESYLTDSGTFKAAAFVNHIHSHEQRIHYCGANAHHKNGIAERAVRTVSNMARAMLLHASTLWKDGIDSSLWPMAVSYSAYQYNHIPNSIGLCPGDFFTGSALPRHRLLAIHVWGCPVYVLDPKLQAGQKLPRWQPRSRRGVFMGFSHLHSSDVPLVLNLQTGSITPQFHVVFDDYFSTVSSIEREADPPDHWSELCLENSIFISTDLDQDAPNHSLFLDDDWLTPDERLVKQRSTVRTDTIRQTFEADSAPSSTNVLTGRSRHRPSRAVPSSFERELTPTVVVQRELEPPVESRPSATTTSTPVSASLVPPSVSTPAPAHIVPSSAVTSGATETVRRSNRSNFGTFTKSRFIDESFLTTVIPTVDPLTNAGQLCYMAGLFTCFTSGQMDISDPRLYLAKKNAANAADNPNWFQAMNGPNANEYIEAMKIEIDALVAQHTWDSVPRPSDRPVLASTWAFKLKRLPDGTPYRYKARFCARGDLQTEGVDFFETYAPVVQWSTIRLLLSTVLTEGWTTRQVDYTNAFVQADLAEEVYVEYPKLFGPVTGDDRVLRLRKSLYGLRQAPRTFFEKLKAGLEERQWTQSRIDPCLFLKKGKICVVYVDDTIFGSLSLANIESEISSLHIPLEHQNHTFTLRNEGAVSAFLGIQIQKLRVNEFHLTQTGLIDRILTATHLQDCNGCDTPATIDPLFADLSGEPFSESWQYDSIIGMLMYLANNTRPDIAYAVHQAARFTHHPRHSHAAGIKRIIRYLKKTKTQGLILCPQANHRVDCYVDSDFAGLFSVEDKHTPVSVKSRTGYVITYRGAPLLWVSKMQTQIALSTMEAEYIALSQSMRDLIPIREVLKEIMTIVFRVPATISYHAHSKAFADVSLGTTPLYNIPASTVYEDNDACLKFARMPKLTPRTKHIGVPYHWFRTQVEELQIHIERVDTKTQLADQFTKGLSTDLFRLARKRLMGW